MSPFAYLRESVRKARAAGGTYEFARYYRAARARDVDPMLAAFWALNHLDIEGVS